MSIALKKWDYDIKEVVVLTTLPKTLIRKVCWKFTAAKIVLNFHAAFIAWLSLCCLCWPFLWDYGEIHLLHESDPVSEMNRGLLSNKYFLHNFLFTQQLVSFIVHRTHKAVVGCFSQGCGQVFWVGQQLKFRIVALSPFGKMLNIRQGFCETYIWTLFFLLSSNVWSL